MPLLTLEEIDQRKKREKYTQSEGIVMEVKGHVISQGAGSSSGCLRAQTPQSERKKKKKKKETLDTFPFPSLPNLSTQGAAPRFPGSPEENNYCFSYLESAALFRCIGK